MVHEVFFGEILSNCDSAPSSPVPEVRICVGKKKIEGEGKSGVYCEALTFWFANRNLLLSKTPYGAMHMSPGCFNNYLVKLR